MRQRSAPIDPPNDRGPIDRLTKQIHTMQYKSESHRQTAGLESVTFRTTKARNGPK